MANADQRKSERWVISMYQTSAVGQVYSYFENAAHNKQNSSDKYEVPGTALNQGSSI